MKRINYILPHLGLGDFFIINGLIRSIIKESEDYVIFCKRKYKDSISFMFSDLENVTFSYLPDAPINRTMLPVFIKHEFCNLIVIGYEHMDYYDGSFEKSFYHSMNINYNNKWDKFCVPRNKEAELDLFNKFNIKENQYIFIHEDKSRGQIIDRSKIENKNLTIVEVNPSITSNIFNWRYIIENAAEVHCIESCFMYFVDLIETNGKLFDHRYTKQTEAITLPINKKNWTVFK